MKVTFSLLLFALILIALSSGASKIMLMPQDVKFFSAVGFNHPMLVTYGAVQLVGGLLLALPSTRIMGTIVLGISFLISAAVLFASGEMLVTAVMLIFVQLLGLIARMHTKMAQ